MKLLDRINSIMKKVKQSKVPMEIQKTWSLWTMRVVTRKELALMDKHLLKDIGLSPGDCLVEARKPFWK